jgi:L-alanine-DL-glutamate epimerase-like enolase superfamily enzyme
MNEKNFTSARIHTITGRVSIGEKLLEELRDYGIEHIDSATIDVETGELIFDVYTIIWED